MDDVAFYQRRLSDFMVEGNRIMLKLNSEESRIWNDALHHLVLADAKISEIGKARKEKVFGGGS
jgi:hypothetical protein